MTRANNTKTRSSRFWYWLVLCVVACCLLVGAARVRIWMSPEGRRLQNSITRLSDQAIPANARVDLRTYATDADRPWRMDGECCTWGNYLDRLYEEVLRDVPSEVFEFNPWLPADMSFGCGDEGLVDLALGGEAERRDKIAREASQQMTRVARPEPAHEEECVGPEAPEDFYKIDMEIESRRTSAFNLRGYLLTRDAIWHARTGDSAEATRVIIELLTHVRSADCFKGFLRPALLRLGSYRALGVLSAALGQLQLSVDQLTAIENALNTPAVHRLLREETLRYAASLTAAADHDSVLPLGSGGGLGSFLGTFASREVWQLISVRLDLLVQLVDATKLGFPEVLDQFYKAAAALDLSDKALLAALDRDGSNDLVISSIGAGGSAKWAVERVNMAAQIVASWRVARTAIALEKYHRAADHYPSSLEELASSGGRLELDDPIDGLRLRYRRSSNGFRLYSVSGYQGLLTRPLERVDDGGRTDTEVMVALYWIGLRLREAMPFLEAFGCLDVLETAFGDFRVSSDIACVVTRRPEMRRVD